MKKGHIWKILLGLGFCPFLFPLLSSVTRMSSWSVWDWIILYSYLYWPTYIIGLALICFSAYKLRKQRVKISESV